MKITIRSKFLNIIRDWISSRLAKNIITKKIFYSKPITNKKWDLFSIELTNHCPMKCDVCPRTNNMTRPLGFMDFSLFKKIIDQASEKINSVWLHQFGDSLVHPEFKEFIIYAQNKGIKTKLSTNAILLNEVTSKKLIESGLDRLIISLDSTDEESQTKTRGVPGIYKKSVENVKKFLEVRKCAGSKKPNTILQMIEYEYTKNLVPIFINQWKNNSDLDEISIGTFVNWNGGVDRINNYTKKLSLLLRFVKKFNKKKSRYNCCHFPWRSLSILWDGTVVPCCFDYDGLYVLGNVKDQSLDEIWNGEKMQALRNEFIHNKVTNKLCSTCRGRFI
ncbi:SPASM domain-containing protein [Candidatus Woesearchaeota archaeon]|nr:SPASM domain-containing protein [Candidatus Woesearchaeota archaeon]